MILFNLLYEFIPGQDYDPLRVSASKVAETLRGLRPFSPCTSARKIMLVNSVVRHSLTLMKTSPSNTTLIQVTTDGRA